jgi:hypothetical protein
MYTVEIDGYPAAVLNGDRDLIAFHLLKQARFQDDVLSMVVGPGGNPLWTESEDLFVREASEEEVEQWNGWCRQGLGKPLNVLMRFEAYDGMYDRRDHQAALQTTRCRGRAEHPSYGAWLKGIGAGSFVLAPTGLNIAAV